MKEKVDEAEENPNVQLIGTEPIVQKDDQKQDDDVEMSADSKRSKQDKVEEKNA